MVKYLPSSPSVIMAMQNKNHKKIIIITSSVFLFIESLYAINIWFSDSKGFEWGSVSDWFNTGGTVGTFIIALIALKKAPDWMAQKHYDIAYGIIEKSIFQDLPSIRSSSLHLHARIATIFRNVKMAIVNKTPIKDFTIEAINETDTMTINFHKECYAIINHLKSVNRTNYNLTEAARSVIDSLQESSGEYTSLYNELYKLVDYVKNEYTGDNEERAKLIKQTDLLIQSTIKNNDKLSAFINKTYHNNKPIADFIVRKNN
jgi:hypothetical protein|nr:MAG TPA: hypothetical protein [Caudoviricetes sp.]